ncbi:glycine betaine ABC transporter substrate-binding protein [Salinibacterium sp. NK8237]|uniref:glycine betaine ABC transporter substrate-binding protein n=1 Tax=Salinibacterium sp. NK8237 TaxID=2792038 RepID=UPI0018CCD8DB|nr:glycine betaine ABC transporter substrate-binding protein [Salinibacterium sp. NK8237]MBH0130799.1 glycine betaine ABC transporter substrate-binding protein [Salinibacterium sp. NK8237]
MISTTQRRGQRRRTRLAVTAALFATVAVALTGCGLKPATAFVPAAGPGSIQEIPDAVGQPITVIGKNYTEALVLEKIAVLAMQAAGFDVTDLANVPGSQPVRNLMLSGEADLSWDYTGTAWLVYMAQEESLDDPQEQWQAVYDADLANGITWLQRAEMNNTYAIAVRSEAVPELENISTLSELANLDADDRTFCVEPEFNSRQDGLDGMLSAYGVERGAADGVADDNIGIYDTGAVYAATDRGACNFGEVFATDGRIEALDLTVLEDDKNYFPSYSAAVNVRTEIVEQYPEIADVFAPITAAISDDVMRRLNGLVDVDGEQPADVAFEWMVEEGFISRP